MKDAVSNFGVMMDLLGINPRELSIMVGADKTLVSRWRTGERRLVSGRRWVKKIAACFLEVDSASEEPLVPLLMHRLYPTEGVTESALRHALEKWLAAEGQLSPEYQEKRRLLLLSLFSEKFDTTMPTSVTVTGEHEVKQKLLEFLEQVAEIDAEGEMKFVCPEGVALITQDEQYANQLMDVLRKVFKSGKFFTVVLRTDYKMSEVAQFAGPWLVAHLLGHVKSWYYDDFRYIEGEKMLGAFGGKIAGLVTPFGRGGKDIKFTIHYDSAEVDGISKRCIEYLRNSTQRFHYQIFQHPNSFLTDCKKIPEGNCFLYSRLPRFCIDSESELLHAGLSEKEVAYVSEQFGPLFVTPNMIGEKTRFYHVFCADDIDEALDQTRQRYMELSEMLGRRVIVSPQLLVDKLKTIKTLITSCKNYSVCFISAEFFDKLEMQIAVLGNETAIAWISSTRCTASKDYTNVAALNGYCATMWDRIPSTYKSRALAIRKINVWLKRARRYGFDA